MWYRMILASANRRLHINGFWYRNSSAIGFASELEVILQEENLHENLHGLLEIVAKRRTEKKRSNCMKVAGAQYKFKCIWRIIEQRFYKASPSYSVQISVFT